MSEQSQDLISSNIKQANLNTLCALVLASGDKALAPHLRIESMRQARELARELSQ